MTQKFLYFLLTYRFKNILLLEISSTYFQHIFQFDLYCMIVWVFKTYYEIMTQQIVERCSSRMR